MRRITFLSVLIFSLFIGCGQEAEQDNSAINQFSSDEAINQEFDERGENSIKIHDNNGNFYSGGYKNSIKDKELGEGLLEYQYDKIAKFIENNYIADGMEPIKISFNIDIETTNVKESLLKEIRKFFSSQNGKYNTIFDGPEDVEVKISLKNGIFGFKVILLNNNLFDVVEPFEFTTSKTLKELEEESKSEWSSIKIKTNKGNFVTYLIMKNPVKVTEFYPDKLTKEDRAITQITFDEADNYCFKKYGGSVPSLYVFEHSLREGKINKPTKFFANAEFVAPFDEANPEDTDLKRADDIVKLKDDECEKKFGKDKIICYAETDYSKVLKFNYQIDKYQSIEDYFKTDDLTFRCMKKGGK